MTPTPSHDSATGWTTESATDSTTDSTTDSAGLPASGRRPSRTSRHPAVGRHRARVVGGVLTGLALCAGAAAATGTLLEPTGSSSTVPVSLTAPPLPAQGVVPPAVVRIPRASRGGARTALAPVRYERRTVTVGSSFSGNASWYGGFFQGRRTANGERFDTNDLTAASKTLPFGTHLRVCRSNQCVVVRVNDRGPYVSGRMLDLTRAARDALGYDGVAYVTATPVATRSVAVRTAARPAARPLVPPAVSAAAAAFPSPTRPISPAGAATLPASPGTVLAADSRPGTFGGSAAVLALTSGLALMAASAGGIVVHRRRS